MRPMHNLESLANSHPAMECNIPEHWSSLYLSLFGVLIYLPTTGTLLMT
jgi:hypothetical protein